MKLNLVGMSEEDKVNTVRIIFVLAFLGCIAYSIYDIHNGNLAMRDSSIVEAQVTGVGYMRQGTCNIFVSYYYNNRMIENELVIDEDTLKKGDTLLIKVSKTLPEQHILFLRRK